MRLRILVSGLVVLGALATGCITTPEKPAPREMGDVGYEVMEDAEKPDGTPAAGRWLRGAADPRAQRDFNKNRDFHEEYVKEVREESRHVEETITEHVGERDEPPPKDNDPEEERIFEKGEPPAKDTSAKGDAPGKTDPPK